MKSQRAPSGKLSLLALIVWPLAWAFCITVGVLYQLVLLHNPYGVFNPLSFIAVLFALGACSTYMTRLSKARLPWAVGLASLFCGVVFLAATYATIGHDHQGAGSWREALGARWSDGIRMWGDAWLLKGGFWKWATILTEGLIAVLVVWMAAPSEAMRPFCEQCVSWVQRTRWRCIVDKPDRDALAILKEELSLDAALAVSPGRGEGRLEYEVQTCRCALLASLRVQHREKPQESMDPAVAIIQDMLLTPRRLERVLDWGERLQPSLAKVRPRIDLPDAVSAGEPFDMSPAPENGEYKSFYRWTGGSRGASFADHDNEYTRALRARVRAGQFHVVKQSLKAQRNADDFNAVAEACIDWMEEPFWFEDWEDADRDDTTLLLLRGIWCTQWAWEARGTAWEPKNYEVFVERMQVADSYLSRVSDRIPKDPTSWAWRVDCCFAFALPVEEAREIFEQARSRAPEHFMAHVRFLYYLTPKWFGSSKMMFEFARTAAHRAPAGNPLAVLIPEAHLEQAMTLRREKGAGATSRTWRPRRSGRRSCTRMSAASGASTA